MLLTPMVIFVGIVSHAAADAGYVLVIPLGAVIFYAAGRHPLAGICAAFAGVSGGFSANPFPSSLDPLLQGITQQATKILDPARVVNPLCNWYFTGARRCSRRARLVHHRQAHRAAAAQRAGGRRPRRHAEDG
jgi:aminobenzoyl-glutamate transport protein